jgi:hypothetical protein
MALANMREDSQLSMENTMPLERLAEQSFPIDLQGVGFWMRDVDDGRIVRCLLTQEALTDMYNAFRQMLWLRAFEENREEIEAAASDIYDTGTSPELVRVTTAELSGRI